LISRSTVRRFRGIARKQIEAPLPADVNRARDHEAQICPLAAFPALAGVILPADPVKPSTGVFWRARTAALLLLFDAGLHLGVVVSIVRLKRG
jgi:hypothetical protein